MTAKRYYYEDMESHEYIVDTSYMFYLGDNLHYNAKGATLLSKIYEKPVKSAFLYFFHISQSYQMI